MKLAYSHSGRQFFFITLVVAERAKILSQLVDETARPQLSAIGEVVKAALLALHRVNPAVTLSDFIIMPDHFHFVMIVDYQRDGRVSPLYLAHRLLDAIETYLERTGALAPPNPACGGVGFQVGRPEPSSAAVAPEPCAVAAAPEPSSAEVGEELVETMVRLVREAITTEAGAWRKAAAGDLASDKGREGASTVVFDRSCYIELSFDSRQLKAIRHYIKLNPARALWKQRHPDRFRRVVVPIERVLGCNGRGFAPNPSAAKTLSTAPNPSAAPNPGKAPNHSAGVGLDGGSGRSPVPSSYLHALGDITLLGSPFFFHVRLTLKKSVEEHEAAIAEIVAEAQRGKIPVSGFISPGEREALRRLKATPGTRFVKLLPYALPPCYDPSAEDSREIAAGRLVLLSAFPETSPISPRDMRCDPSAAHEFRRNCQAMNDFAAALCAR